jgi:prevent-host-death family protein
MHDYLISEGALLTVNVKDAKAGLSGLVDRAVKGEFVRIMRRGKCVAVLVSVAAADIACKVMEKKRPGLVAYLRTFPGGGFERSGTPSRALDL